MQIGSRIEEHEEIEIVEPEPSGMALDSRHPDRGEAADREARVADPEPPTRTILQIADRGRADQYRPLFGLRELGRSGFFGKGGLRDEQERDGDPRGAR